MSVATLVREPVSATASRLRAARRRALHGHRGLIRYVVPIAVASTLIGRLPYLARPLAADEAGYLLVAKQWSAAGRSLYGGYWVDRPPLLISIYQLAGALGGTVALRLLGAVAAVAVVVLSVATARLVGGDRASRWTAVVAAALCVSPLAAAQEVDGELLAAPFVALGIFAVARFLTIGRREPRSLGLIAGASACCAVLVKQNMADVVIFGVVALGVAWLHGELGSRDAIRFASSFAAGAAGAGAAVAGWTLAHGTSLIGVVKAMYVFRLHAGQVVATGGSGYASTRLHALLLAGLATALIPIAVAVVAAIGRSVATRRRPGWPLWALVATVAFDVVSIGVGGAYWLHYLVELIVPCAIACGLIGVRRRAVATALAAIAVTSSVIAWPVGLQVAEGRPGLELGAAIARSAAGGDTLVTVYGHPEVNQGAGLGSPYPYLWSLPIKTRDADLSRLDSVLVGDRAPTWFVTWSGIGSWGLSTGAVEATLRADYHVVAELCGHTVYLHDGVERAAPGQPSGC